MRPTSMEATSRSTSAVWLSSPLFIRLDDAHDKLGNFWETIVLSMIGETLEDGCEITGARIVDKVSHFLSKEHAH